MAGHNKVEQLQAAMEKQDYNPFGRFFISRLNVFKKYLDLEAVGQIKK